MRTFFKIAFITIFVFSNCYAKNKDNPSSLEVYKNRISELKNINTSNKAKIKSINEEIKSKKITAKKLDELQKLKNSLTLSRFRTKKEIQLTTLTLRRNTFHKSSTMDLKISQKKLCDSPCSVTIEALPDKKQISLIKSYTFYVDKKEIHSLTPKITTTINYDWNSIGKKNISKFKLNQAIVKLFKIRAIGIIDDIHQIQSRKKFVAIKASKNDLNSITLLTNEVLPLGSVQISTGLDKTNLLGTIDGITIKFNKNTETNDENIWSAVFPYTLKNSVTLTIENKNFIIKVKPLPVVSSPKEFLLDQTNGMIDYFEAVFNNDDVKNMLGSKSMSMLNTMQKGFKAYAEYIDKNATTELIQKHANLLSSLYGSNPDLENLISQNTSLKKSYVNSLNQQDRILNVITSFSKLLISDAKAADPYLPFFEGMVQEFIGVGLRSLYDGMINKCYIEKGRKIPEKIKNLESMTNDLVNFAGASALGLDGGVTYVVSNFAAAGLVTVIHYDCEGYSDIVPKIVIKNQPFGVVTPGESLNYMVKCDVGDERYYNPSSIFTKKTSQFVYLSDELDNNGPLVNIDRILNGTSGLGINIISDEHLIRSTSKLLESTQFYKDNLTQYTIFNKLSCNGNKSYSVGYLMPIDPSFSCNFQNEPNNVFLPGEEETIANRIYFDLQKTFNCPKAVLYTKVTNFTLQVAADDSFNSSMPGLIYEWDFGDGTRITTNTFSHNHIYKTVGDYLVTVTVKDPTGGFDQKSKWIKISPQEITYSFKIDPSGTYLYTDPMTEKDLGDYLCRDPYLRLGCIGPKAATRIDLFQFMENQAIRLKAGDSFVIRSSGTFQNAPTEYGGTDVFSSMGGVFGGAAGYLMPGPANEFWPFPSLNTYAGESTDIPYDFDISSEGDLVQVPEGATYIEFTANDVNFANNSDPNNDFKVYLTFFIKNSN